MDVNQTIVKVLEEVGVDYVFGGSGQVNASMLLAPNQSDKIKTIIIQNEQAASFMAAGYAMFSKKLGVCFATGGPVRSICFRAWRLLIPIRFRCWR